jgi:hypothetical protein
MQITGARMHDAHVVRLNIVRSISFVSLAKSCHGWHFDVYTSYGLTWAYIGPVPQVHDSLSMYCVHGPGWERNVEVLHFVCSQSRLLT